MEVTSIDGRAKPVDGDHTGQLALREKFKMLLMGVGGKVGIPLHLTLGPMING